MSEIKSTEFETVIGLEVHLQFNTRTKNFCGCINQFGAEPNSHTCPVCLGLPGSLPVLNKTALEYAIKVGVALNCNISSFIKFDRKNYFYPDLPKGYQISQYDYPIAKDGFVMIKTQSGEKKIRIHRAHLEEDAGKLIHEPTTKSSLVDYNRTGTPLLEIVTYPDINCPQEAYDYLTNLKLILQYLNVSDCDMEKGSLRCDANISLRKKGETQLGTKAELKNLNSFKAVKSSLEYEENRQGKILSAGNTIKQETRLWNEQQQQTLSMRTKEEAHDYRYFPEPDLVPFTINQQTIEEIASDIPELPDKKFKRLMSEYNISPYDAQILIQDPDLTSFFESCCKRYDQTKKICNWINGALMKELNEKKALIKDINLKVDDFIDLILKVEEGEISSLVGKDILKMCIDSGKSPDEIVKTKALLQVSDTNTLEKIVDEVLKENQKIVNEIKSGNQNALSFLIGQTMKKSQGKANPKIVGEILKRRINT